MPKLIHLSEEGGTVIDSIPDDYEDAFTLESFGDLCESYQEESKNFLIARVTTMDPKQPEKLFYSYYNAYQLNKILFQTQNYNDKRLLHRLFVLNPLTNADIIGDVEYYKVEKCEEVPLASPIHPRELASPMLTAPASPLSHAFPEDAWTHNHHAVTVEDAAVDSDIPSQAAEKIESKSKLRIQIQMPNKQDIALEMGPKSPLLKGQLTQFSKPITATNESQDKEKESPSKRKNISFQNALLAGSPSFDAWVDTLGEMTETLYVWNAVRFATDEDFLRKQPVRHFFRNNSLAPEDVQLYQMPDMVDEEVEEEAVEDGESVHGRGRKGKCCVM